MTLSTLQKHAANTILALGMSAFFFSTSARAEDPIPAAPAPETVTKNANPLTKPEVAKPAPLEFDLKAADTNGDGIVSEAEFAEYQKKLFAQADTNHDGKIDAAELAAIKMPTKGTAAAASTPNAPKPEQRAKIDSDPRGHLHNGSLMARLDKNKDGKIEKSELPPRLQESFAEMDKNKDGFLDEQELKAAMAAHRARPGAPKAKPKNT